jgi:hypothetical protein
MKLGCSPDISKMCTNSQQEKKLNLDLKLLDIICHEIFSQ